MYGLFKALDLGSCLPPVDYHQSIEWLLKEFTKAVITEDKSLHLLYGLQNHSISAGLPSWVLDRTDFSYSTDGHASMMSESHTATSDSVARYSFPESNELSTIGVEIDVVTACAVHVPPPQPMIVLERMVIALHNGEAYAGKDTIRLYHSLWYTAFKVR
jgi:hypothetical protein